MNVHHPVGAKVKIRILHLDSVLLVAEEEAIERIFALPLDISGATSQPQTARLQQFQKRSHLLPAGTGLLKLMTDTGVV